MQKPKTASEASVVDWLVNLVKKGEFLDAIQGQKALIAYIATHTP
ncbi:hypothetical protein ACFPU0_04670 [Pseudomonas sp. GCM10022186]